MSPEGNRILDAPREKLRRAYDVIRQRHRRPSTRHSSRKKEAGAESEQNNEEHHFYSSRHGPPDPRLERWVDSTIDHVMETFGTWWPMIEDAVMQPNVTDEDIRHATRSARIPDTYLPDIQAELEEQVGLPATLPTSSFEEEYPACYYDQHVNEIQTGQLKRQNNRCQCCAHWSGSGEMLLFSDSKIIFSPFRSTVGRSGASRGLLRQVDGRNNDTLQQVLPALGHEFETQKIIQLLGPSGAVPERRWSL